MLVSIIIPTYNRLELLKRAIASVEAQTYDYYELIIVDDASTDGTAEYLLQLEHKVISLKENSGVSYARNRGADYAKGDCIAFLDSDDSWPENKLLQQVNFHKENSAVQCSFGKERWFRHNKEVKRPKKYHASDVVEFQDLLEFTFIGPSSVMIQREIFQKLNGFDESLAVCEDFDFWLRVTQITPMYLAQNVTIDKHAGSHVQLSTSVLSLETFRVEALMKHKENKCVKAVIRKKLEIIHAGAKKYQNHDMLAFSILKIKDLQ